MCLFGVGVSFTLFGVDCLFQNKNSQGMNYSPHLLYVTKLCVVQVNGNVVQALEMNPRESSCLRAVFSDTSCLVY